MRLKREQATGGSNQKSAEQRVISRMRADVVDDITGSNTFRERVLHICLVGSEKKLLRREFINLPINETGYRRHFDYWPTEAHQERVGPPQAPEFVLQQGRQTGANSG